MKNVVCTIKSEFTRDQITRRERARLQNLYLEMLSLLVSRFTERTRHVWASSKFCNLIYETLEIRPFQFPKRPPDFEAFCTPTYIEKRR